MRYLFLLLVLPLIFSCNEKKKEEFIEGDIYIKLIDVLTLSNQFSEEEIKNKVTDSLANNNSDSEKKLLEYFKILIEHNLYNKPHFKLKLKSGEIINVYSDESEFLKIKKELDSFDKEKEKITVKFEGAKKPNNIIDSDGIFNQSVFEAVRIVSVKKTTGKTDWSK